MLRFIKANNQAKLKEIAKWYGRKVNVYSFSLPSGHTCPFAKGCLSKADRITGKITDGVNMLYRCFSASDESRYPTVRKSRWGNFDILRKLDTESMIDELMQALPNDCDICRIHIGGDFFNERYFQAWVAVAKLNPQRIFYAYTKSLPYWIKSLNEIPNNLILNASRDSRYDDLIDDYKLKVAEVVFSLDEANEKQLPIDHNEYHAINNQGNFALLIHGTQPKNSNASNAIKSLKKSGVKYGYSR